MNLAAPLPSPDGTPALLPPLDPGFRPLVLQLPPREPAGSRGDPTTPLVIALERDHGRVSVFRTHVAPPDSDPALLARQQYRVERTVKHLLWQMGGWKLTLGGPRAFSDRIAQLYSLEGARHFDVDLMQRVYGRPFQVERCDPEDAPSPNEVPITLGGHLDGCRLGFDLGASDYKLAAVRDGEAVFTTELPWDPKNEPDPEVHYRLLHQGLQQAAKHLPRVDAIGGSAAGIYIDNQVKVASLFRSVPSAKFASHVSPLFQRLQQTWGVPLEVANDGDVTALAAALNLRVQGILGIAMGSSQAAGYIDPQGHITGWLNELAFAPVDTHPFAPSDEWSQDRGVGAQYFSQQATGRLLKPAGIQLEPDVPLPEKLKFLQGLMRGGDTRAERVYQTIGVYLGYALAQYDRFYDFEHALLLGRVTTGPGADILIAQARQVLQKEFPTLAERIHLHLPDEQSKRVGQAVAAASLPKLPH